jgi:hypothetical protein
MPFVLNNGKILHGLLATNKFKNKTGSIVASKSYVKEWQPVRNNSLQQICQTKSPCFMQ